MPQVGWMPHWSYMSTRGCSALTRRAPCLARGGIVGVAQSGGADRSASRGVTALELKWLPSSSIAPAVPKSKCDFA